MKIRDFITCQTCGGTGHTPVVTPTAEFLPESELCSECGGDGYHVVFSGGGEVQGETLEEK